MLETLNAIPRKPDGEELKTRGTPLFPCCAYQADIHSFITGEIPPHWHRELELFVLLEGSVRLCLVDRHFLLAPGDCCLVNTNVLHGFSCAVKAPCRYRSFVFDAGLLSGAPGSAFDMLYLRAYLAQGAPAAVLAGGPAAPFWRNAFDDAFAACRDEPFGSEFLVRAGLSRMIVPLLGQATVSLPQQAPRPNAIQEARMKTMLRWLDQHYSEQVSAAALAASVDICVRECQRAFARFLHASPMQYLARRRVAFAAEQLVCTELSITEIGFRCGFESPSYFSRQFRAITGFTPNAYRRACRTG